jgi:hypothetical protein
MYQIKHFLSIGALRTQYIICVQLMNLAHIDDEHTTDRLFNSLFLRVQTLWWLPVQLFQLCIIHTLNILPTIVNTRICNTHNTLNCSIY